jgi:hypothetical protein
MIELGTLGSAPIVSGVLGFLMKKPNRGPTLRERRLQRLRALQEVIRAHDDEVARAIEANDAERAHHVGRHREGWKNLTRKLKRQTNLKINTSFEDNHPQFSRYRFSSHSTCVRSAPRYCAFQPPSQRLRPLRRRSESLVDRSVGGMRRWRSLPRWLIGQSRRPEQDGDRGGHGDHRTGVVKASEESAATGPHNIAEDDRHVAGNPLKFK